METLFWTKLKLPGLQTINNLKGRICQHGKCFWETLCNSRADDALFVPACLSLSCISLRRHNSDVQAKSSSDFQTMPLSVSARLTNSLGTVGPPTQSGGDTAQNVHACLHNHHRHPAHQGEVLPKMHNMQVIISIINSILQLWSIVSKTMRSQKWFHFFLTCCPKIGGRCSLMVRGRQWTNLKIKEVTIHRRQS